MYRALIETGGILLFFAVCLFGAAGTLSWGAGWEVMALYTAFYAYGLYSLDRDLIEMRSRNEPDAIRRDVALATASFVFLFPLLFFAAGLDAKRFRWSPPLPSALHAVGLIAFVAGHGFAHWAAYTNRFFAKFVRIQHERDHTVVRQGPYAYIRHPGYAGGIFTQLAVPLILGSLWAFVPTVIGIVLLVTRAKLKDAFLRANLPGYREYAADVRWRLLPGLW